MHGLQCYNSKSKTIHHPITIVSGQFKKSKLIWAMLTKEAHAIYMAVKKITF